MTHLHRAAKQGSRFLNPVPTAVGGPGMFFRVLPRYITNREERVPAHAPGPFRTDPAIYATPPAGGLRVTWMGHSSTLIEIDGARILIDPVWDERASPLQAMGPKRFFAPPLPLEDLPPIDIVLISHDHYDHLGKGTVQRLATLPAAARAHWVTSLGVGALLRRFGVAGPLFELDWTDTLTVAGLTVTALPARHFSGRSLGNRFETLWSSFVLKGPAHTVFYGADSGWWEGFREIGRHFGPFDLSLLEIGAYDDLWSDIHLGPDGAVRAFQDLGGTGLLMPVHWGLFDLALHGWRQPIERLLALAAERGIAVWSPEPGLPTELSPQHGRHPSPQPGTDSASTQPLLTEWWRRPAPLSPAGKHGTTGVWLRPEETD